MYIYITIIYRCKGWRKIIQVTVYTPNEDDYFLGIRFIFIFEKVIFLDTAVIFFKHYITTEF